MLKRIGCQSIDGKIYVETGLKERHVKRGMDYSDSAGKEKYDSNEQLSFEGKKTGVLQQAIFEKWIGFLRKTKPHFYAPACGIANPCPPSYDKNLSAPVLMISLDLFLHL